LGVYNVVSNYNFALQVQPQILIFLSLVTWSQCQYYGRRWSLFKVTVYSIAIMGTLGAIEVGLVFALRVAHGRGHDWALTLMAVLAAVLLVAGVLRHYVDMLKTRTDGGISLRFAALDAIGDVASLLSVVFQETLDILGLVIYGSEFVVWVVLMVLVFHFRIRGRKLEACDQEDTQDRVSDE
jgi:hypothetical protein